MVTMMTRIMLSRNTIETNNLTNMANMRLFQYSIEADQITTIQTNTQMTPNQLCQTDNRSPNEGKIEMK